MLPPISLPTVPVQGYPGGFPVRRILCIGRNYAAHVLEMGNDARTPPTHFTKSPPSLLPAPEPVEMTYPPATTDLQHELELVIAIGRGGRNIPASEALEHVFAYAVGLDMTRRDLQHQAKKKGGPWAAGKDFDQAAICATMVRAVDVGHPATGIIALHVNGETRQQADLSHMVWSVPEIIRFLSGTLTLEPGDLIYTGTPAGVGPVVPGDLLEGEISGLPSLTVRITPPRAASEVAAS